ncbi:MAG: hypothetical protein ACTSXL_04820 [Alphaproteobacteria bacterium]|nr:MAG: hypothetical protein B6I23_00360 [Rickettsiaceae bacterium 4572_127]
MEEEILYSAITHNLFLTIFAICAFVFGCFFYKKILEKNKETLIELTLLVLVASLSLGTFFNGENLFTSLVAKAILFLLFFFSTGRIVLLFKKNGDK